LGRRRLLRDFWIVLSCLRRVIVVCR
jgi:hypothetical protein